MNRRGLAAAVMVAPAAMTVIGCSHTVSGSAQRVVEGVKPVRGYGYTDDRCGLLDDSTVQEIVGADELVRPYSGAVCQYVLMRQSTTVDLTFSWFETGSFDRERDLAQANAAQITDVVVERHRTFLARRSVTGSACAATADAAPGVASWWVQFRGDSPVDPCQVAQTLLSRTLASDM